MKACRAWLQDHGLPRSLFGRLACLLALVVLLPEVGGSLLHARGWVEVGIRLGVLAAAAWLGARWLAQPVHRLAQAAQALGEDIHRAPLPEAGPLEWREATRVFNEMQAQICQQLHARDRFVAGVSHDLRTPLTRMALRAESLPTAALRAQFGRDIGEMNRLIAATLDHLRGVAQAEPQVLLDVDSLLCSLADDYAASGHMVAVVHRDGWPLCAPFSTQAQALRRCVGHLVNSAMRYGGGACIQSYDQGAQLCIEVRDDGLGDRERLQDRLRLPLMGARQARPVRGAGLGLSIARDMAQRLGGELHVHSRPEGGLAATLVLQRPPQEGPGRR